jgi:hypothetical protein
MKIPQWSFRKMGRGEMSVDPIQSEFFSTEAISGLAEALVRESVQNSLDAGLSGQIVKVRFWLSGTENALPAKAAALYFAGLEEHLKAEHSGLQSVPKLDSDVPFVAIEDFNTRGLCGDPEQDKDESGIKNDFYYFWRNVGRSGKQEKDRGRWGVGKNVFPASSNINTFFGLTIREGDSAGLLMGQSVLKVHNLDGNRIYPYGFFAGVGKDEFPKPFADEEDVKAFTEAFGLSRANETGLSIVIPFSDADITAENIISAVLRQYFHPVTSGVLEVVVEKNSTQTTITQDSIATVVASQPSSLREELEPVIALASWAVSAPSVTMLNKPAERAAPKWNKESVSESALAQLRPLFEKGERLAFEVPLAVHPSSPWQK